MLVQVVEVFDVYEDGQVWVTMWWSRGDGMRECHSIAVDAASIERMQPEP